MGWLQGMNGYQFTAAVAVLLLLTWAWDRKGRDYQTKSSTSDRP